MSNQFRVVNVSRRVFGYFGKYYFLRGGMAFNWSFYSSASQPKRYHLSTERRIVGVSPRDLFDQAFDFIYVGVWQTLCMFIREEMCSHPSAACYVIDEGDPEIGVYLQDYCGKCGAAILPSMIDRY